MSCLCSSGNKTFLFVGSNLSYERFKDNQCSLINKTQFITSLTAVEYDVLRSCKPKTQQGHKLGLVYNWTSNETTNCSQNFSNPYFWVRESGKGGTCVDGFPVTTANNRPTEPGCKAAAILAGSSNDVSWVSCGEEYPFICRQRIPDLHGADACEQAMTTNSKATIIAATMPLAFILILLLLLCLRYYYVKKRENRREEINIDQPYEQCKLVFKYTVHYAFCLLLLSFKIFSKNVVLLYHHSKCFFVKYFDPNFFLCFS